MYILPTDSVTAVELSQLNNTEYANDSLKGLSSAIEGGSKVVSIYRASLNLPTLRSGIQFHTSAILKFT
jgi:hypothetical protein